MSVQQEDVWIWRCDHCKHSTRTTGKKLPYGWQKRQVPYAIPEPGDRHYCGDCCAVLDAQANEVQL